MLPDVHSCFSDIAVEPIDCDNEDQMRTFYPVNMCLLLNKKKQTDWVCWIVFLIVLLLTIRIKLAHAYLLFFFLDIGKCGAHRDFTNEEQVTLPCPSRICFF